MEEQKFTVRLVDSEEKSLQEIETKLVEEHEKELIQNEQSSQETPVVEETPELEQTSSSNFEIDDDAVLSHIKTKYNREVSKIDDLFQQNDLDEDVAAFQKYKRETGRGIEDFIKLNRDIDSLDPDKLLADYYKDNGDDDEDVEYKLSKLQYEEDYDSESEIKEKKLAKKQELKKAKKYFNDLKEQYKAPLESRESFVPQEEKENYEAYKSYRQATTQAEEEQAKRSKYFTDKTSELFSERFEGFGFNLDDNNKVVYKPAESPDLLKDQSNLQNFVSRFLNDEGYLKDAESFHRAIAVASNPEKFAKFFYEKGMADAVGNVAKESKNIDMTRQATQVTPAPGFKVTAIDDERGNRLVIRNKNKN